MDRSNPHLYVMQNQHGAIKIGRSHDPVLRLKSLEKSTGCKIKLIISLPENGDQEERVLRRLSKYHFCGDWFSGCMTCRDTVSRTLRVPQLRFPFTWKRRSAEKWRWNLHLASVPARLRREQVRLIGLLKAVESGLHEAAGQRGSPWLDFAIWFEMNERFNRVFWGVNRPVDSRQLEIPHYTRDLSSALSLWPQDKRPDGWCRQHPGSTFELNCCIAGLAELWRIDARKIKPRLN